MMTMSKTLITSRDKKGLHIVSLFEVALNKAGLDDDGAQRLIENGGEFQEGLHGVLEKHSTPNQFADEEIESSYFYPSGYKLKGIAKQVNILHQLLDISYVNINEKLVDWSLPKGAEGWFAIPRWQKVAKTYPEAVKIVLGLIKKNRGLWNYRNGQIDQQHLKQSAKTAKMFQALGEQQKDRDILIVPCQFGLRHRGRSVRRGIEVMRANEFGLDSFSVGIMLLTHSERLQQCDDLWIDCAGDEFSYDGDSSFGQVPYFGFINDEVKFGTNDDGRPLEEFGSSSAFVSPTLKF